MKGPEVVVGIEKSSNGWIPERYTSFEGYRSNVVPWDAGCSNNLQRQETYEATQG